MPKDLKDTLTDKIANIIGTQVQKAIISGLKKSIMKMVRLLVLILVGTIIISVGLIFIYVSAYAYLLQFFTQWVAALIVGFLSILLGFILMVAAYLSR